MYKKTTTVEEFFDTAAPPMMQNLGAQNGIRTPHPKALKPVLRVDVPLMIRLLEYAKEDAVSDIELHEMVERMMELCEYGEVLEMDDYDAIVIANVVYDDSNKAVTVGPTPPVTP